ncbi:MAG: (d)CMP kinase [Bacteroidetes bacterium]|nr:(d)CMP kinase [Bacteroidota bacterium]
MSNITIAIDGHSSCGKSTLAKDLARALDYVYVDSGAMYRAVTLFFLENEVDPIDAPAVDKALDAIDIRFEKMDGQNHTFLNGENVEEEIRKMYISDYVSPVAAIPNVRRALVQQQRDLGKDGGIVMDGRDIGTVVFPDAELKIFLTADLDIRTRRRFEELMQKNIPSDLALVKQNLLERDHIDSTRSDSPLKKAEDAVVIDNSRLNREDQLKKVYLLAKERILKTTA